MLVLPERLLFPWGGSVMGFGVTPVTRAPITVSAHNPPAGEKQRQMVFSAFLEMTSSYTE